MILLLYCAKPYHGQKQ